MAAQESTGSGIISGSMSEQPVRQTLPRSARVRSRKDFTRIFNLRLRASDQWITLYAAPRESETAGDGVSGPPQWGEGARLGISVGRRVGNAVRRNRVKRLVREAFRRLRHELPAGMDCVVVPRPGPEPTLPDLQQSIRDLARRLERRLERRDPPDGC